MALRLRSQSAASLCVSSSEWVDERVEVLDPSEAESCRGGGRRLFRLGEMESVEDPKFSGESSGVPSGLCKINK